MQVRARNNIFAAIVFVFVFNGLGIDWSSMFVRILHPISSSLSCFCTSLFYLFVFHSLYSLLSLIIITYLFSFYPFSLIKQQSAATAMLSLESTKSISAVSASAREPLILDSSSTTKSSAVVHKFTSNASLIFSDRLL